MRGEGGEGDAPSSGRRRGEGREMNVPSVMTNAPSSSTFIYSIPPTTLRGQILALPSSLPLFLHSALHFLPTSPALPRMTHKADLTSTHTPDLHSARRTNTHQSGWKSVVAGTAPHSPANPAPPRLDMPQPLKNPCSMSALNCQIILRVPN